jgi:hydroxyacylglutathione hydrolase
MAASVVDPSKYLISIGYLSHAAELVLHLIPLPALADNYIWLLHDDEGHALVVDPGEADVVEQVLMSRGLQLRAILLTHHHHDHLGGVAALLDKHDVVVYAPVDARIPIETRQVHDGDRIEQALPSLDFQVIHIPGHTLSHIAYFGAGILFCGDTLFSLGCGRLFEGTPAQMLASLDRLATLPGDTLICGGHEYTEANGRFAHGIEPDNADLHRRQMEVAQLRAQGEPSLPVTLASELASNPFLRIDSAAVRHWCAAQGVASDRIACFAAVRNAKDNFRG